MKRNKTFMKVCTGVAAIIASLTMTAPMVTQAATTILIDDSATANNCGKYDNQTAETDPVAAIGGGGDGEHDPCVPGDVHAEREDRDRWQEDDD